MPVKFTIEIDNVAKIKKAIIDLSKASVLVGIPEENAKRKEEPGTKTKPQEMNNATLGYIHEYGSSLKGSQPRPWLKPGLLLSQDKWGKYLQQAAQLSMEGKSSSADAALDAAGSIATNAVKNRITAGIAPPLAESTRRQRMAKHKNTPTGISDLPPQFGGMTPLVDTHQMLDSITYVVRKG